MTEYLATEDEEQMVVVDYLERRGLVFSHIPNNTYTAHMNQKMKNRRLGLRAGLPDLLIALPGTGLLFIEMKRRKRAKVSWQQQEWIDTLNQCPGTAAHVCYGADEAIRVVERYALGKVGQPF